MLTYWRIYFEKKKKHANISLSIESVRGTAPLTTQQPERDFKVLKAESMEGIEFVPIDYDGFYLYHSFYGFKRRGNEKI